MLCRKGEPDPQNTLSIPPVGFFHPPHPKAGSIIWGWVPFKLGLLVRFIEVVSSFWLDP
jgi:hypothetical protein